MAAVTSPAWRSKGSQDNSCGCSSEDQQWVLPKGVRTRSHHPAQRSWKELQFLPTSFVPSPPVVLLVVGPAGSVSRARGLHSSLPCQGCSLSHLFVHFSEHRHFSLPPASLTEREGQEKTWGGGGGGGTDPVAQQRDKLPMAERGSRMGPCPLPAEQEDWDAQHSQEQPRLVKQGWAGFESRSHHQLLHTVTFWHRFVLESLFSGL